MPAGLAKEVVELMAKLVGDADDMNVPGFHLHPLKGSLSGYWAVSVSGIGVLRSASITAMPLMSTIWIIISEAQVHGYA